MSKEHALNNNVTLRKFGIALIGDVPWGTHLCQFYDSKQDLIDILVPYFAEGLNSNEFCMWVTSPPLEVDEAQKALAKAIPNIDEYLREGQLEIVSYSDWYLQGGKFDCNRVLQGWVDKEKNALKNGFEGLRLTGNTFWIERSLWQSFVDYEEAVNSVIGEHKMLALCTYCLTNCSGTDVLDVVRNHIGTLVKQGNKWVLVEDVLHRKKAEEALRKSEKEYGSLFSNMIDGFAYCQMIFDEKETPVDFVYLQINDAFEKITGLKKDLVVGKKVTEAIPGIKSANPELFDIYGKVALTGRKERFEVFFKPLSMWLSISVYSPRKGYFAAVFEDITERKKTEYLLHENELKFRTVADFAYDWEYWIAPDGNLIYVSPSCKRITGYDANEFLKEPGLLTGIVHPQDKSIVGPHFALISSDELHAVDFRILTREGETRWISHSCKAVFDATGKWIGRRASNRDITERKQQEREIENIAKFPSENPNPIFRIDGNGTILYGNQAGASFLTTWNSKVGGQVPENIRQIVADTLASNSRVNVEKTYGTRTFSLMFAPVISESYVNIYANDITERKKAEAQVLEQLHMLDLAHVIVKNMKDEIIFWNTGAQKLYGFSKEEALGKIPRQLLKTEFPKPIEQIKEELLLNGKWEGELVHQKADGTQIYVASHWTLHKDINGTPVAIIEVNNDITDRKKAEETLTASEQRWATTLASIGDAVIATDTSGKITFMNGEAEKLTGWALSAALQNPIKTVFNILNEQTRLKVENPIDRVLKEGMVVGLANHTLLIRKDGLEVPIDDSGAPIKDKDGKTTGVVLVFRDIAERKKAEEAILKMKEEAECERKRLETILEATSSAVVIIEAADGKFSFVNKRAMELYGFDTLGLDLERNVAKVKARRADGANYPIVEMPVSRSLRLGIEVHNEEMIIENAKGRAFPIMASTAPLRDMQGNITAAIVVWEDITESKETEKKLEEYGQGLEKLVEERTKQLELSSLYARNLLEASLDPLVTISVEGKITDVNQATELVTGCAREKLVGSDFSDYFTEPDKARAGYLKVFSDGYVRDYPLSICHRSGRVTDVLYNATVYTNDVGEILGVFAAARDITEIKKAEADAQEAAKKLKDSERLAAIGATAGMVGHDIRNPLQAITGDVYLAKTELASIAESDEKNSIQESLTEIEKNVDYINKIVQDLQDYARPLRPNPGEADLKLIIDRLLAKNGVPENVKVTVEVEPDARKIVADSDYLNRILFNLVTNAVQAMPKGGKLTIQAYKEANDIIIAVKDTGVGIPEKVKDKLFTPMFTTKSKGQGFGLAVIKRMTEALGGTVTFESQEGHGTTFIIRLPSK